MFTGIVQGLGEIIAINEPSPTFRTHTIALPENCAQDLSIGASVAHNGCCLTITAINGNQASFDLMAETLNKTNLGSLTIGSKVNIERAARIGDEIGGHLMSGHIMTTTTILASEIGTQQRRLTFALPPDLQPYILEKGFIGLDGCSLTIADVTPNSFSVYLIPETLERTLFGSRQIGDIVNIEIDPQTQAIVHAVAKILGKS